MINTNTNNYYYNNNINDSSRCPDYSCSSQQSSSPNLQQSTALQCLKWQQQYFEPVQFKSETLEDLCIQNSLSSCCSNETSSPIEPQFINSQNNANPTNCSSIFGLSLSLDSVANQQCLSCRDEPQTPPSSSSSSSSISSSSSSNTNTNTATTTSHKPNTSPKSDLKWKYHQYQPNSSNFTEENQKNTRFSDYVAAVNQQQQNGANSPGKNPAFYSWMSPPAGIARKKRGKYLTPPKLCNMSSSGIKKKNNCFSHSPNSSLSSSSSLLSSSSSSLSSSKSYLPSSNPNSPSSPQVLRNLISSNSDGFKKIGRIRRRKQNKDYDQLVTCFVKTRRLKHNSKK